MKRATLWALLVVNLSAFAQQWEWAKVLHFNLPTTADASQVRIAPDNNGNFYLSYFHWDSNQGYPDGSAIGKYDSQGNELWQKVITSKMRIQDIATENSGALYITGDFRDTVYIDNTILVSSGQNDAFFAKFDSNGNLQWAKTSGGLYNDAGYGLWVDSKNNVFLTGEYSDSAYFYGNWISQDISRYTVSKYDADGSLFFSVSDTSGQQWSRGERITLDKSGNIFVLGGCRGGMYGAQFMCMLDTSGKLKWQKGVTSFTDRYHDFFIDNDKNIFATGDGSWTNGCWTIMDRLDSAGTQQWHKSCELHCDYYGDGSLQGITSNSSDMIALGYSNCHGLLLVKYALDGSTIYLDTIPGIDFIRGMCIRKDAQGKYLTGGFIRGAIKLGNDSLYTSSMQIFIAKFSDNGLSTSVPTQNTNCEITIFPNPTSGVCTIEFSSCNIPTEVVVRNAMGACVLQKRWLSQTKQELDLSIHPKGVYFVELVAAGKRITKKIVLE